MRNLTFTQLESVAFSFIHSLPHITDFIQNKISGPELGGILTQTTEDTIKLLARDGNGLWLFLFLECDLPNEDINKRELLGRFTQIPISKNQITPEQITHLEKLTSDIFGYYLTINEPFLN